MDKAYINIVQIAGVFGGVQIASALYKMGFRLGKTIGEGSYCKVKAAEKHCGNGQAMTMACKSIDKRKASDDYVGKFLPRELSIIRMIRHPNIVNVYDIIETEERVFVFMEMCSRGDLLDYIRNKGMLPEQLAKLFFRQLIDAVDYLHRLDISHRDLKCENILLANKQVVKIADFGFARWCRDASGRRLLSKTFCGSAAYAAPEILQGVPYNPAMYDVWSLGCVLFIMLTAAMPYDDANVNKMLQVQLTESLVFPTRSAKIVSRSAKNLIEMMLEPDVTCRMNIAQIKRHDWMSGGSSTNCCYATRTETSTR